MVVAIKEGYPTQAEDKYKKAINEIAKVKPLSYARVTIIDGEQGSGKSMSAVAIVVDATFENVTSIVLPSGETVKAEPYRNKVSKGYALVGYARIWIDGKPRVMQVPPKSCVVADSVRVIYNGHLHGIRYAHMELEDIIKNLNGGMIKNCYLIIDEAYLTGDRREGLSPLVKAMTKLSKQMRKRHVHLIMCTPDSTELDLRFQKIEVEHIVCSYDEITEMVTKFINNRKKYKKTREISYSSKLYRKYFDTDEIFEMTDVQIERAMAMASIRGR